MDSGEWTGACGRDGARARANAICRHAPDADSVDRYRVSFQTDDRIVPHVDRRGRNVIARTE
jgi:hypothetical protein